MVSAQLDTCLADGAKTIVFLNAGANAFCKIRSEELFMRFKEALIKIRNKDATPVVCGVLPKRGLGGEWLFRAIAVNCRLVDHCMCLVWRPPNASDQINSSLWEEINRAARYSKVCVVGDFKYRNVDCWVNEDNFLKQAILEPTQESNIIYLSLTNRKEAVTQVEIGGQLGNSDHKEIRYTLKWHETFKIKNKRKVPDFRKANFEGLREYLQGVT
ncbi:hypothetical protein E2C01_076135 [Portunus trituberculatus]|uniref:Uncharacterized protein n=1 Tax=Portunus trituberculatus TaxID=210409 RepID=A0A5B7IMV2_PORTR|nr:hypothetical protein [Portunus trituberculatus]